MAQAKIVIKSKKRKQLQHKDVYQGQHAENQQKEEYDLKLIPKLTKRRKKLLQTFNSKQSANENQIKQQQKILQKFSDDEADEQNADVENQIEARESSYDGDDDDDDKQEQSNEKQGSQFSRAFESILNTPSISKRRRDKKGPQSKAKGVLEQSEEFTKAKKQAKEDGVVAKSKRILRMEMRKRGHVKVGKKGDDPQSDVYEKQLQRLATRGVVQLFNAVAKAQKVQRDSYAAKGRSQAAKMTKASITAELKRAKQQKQPQKEEKQDVGWKVLKDDFTGLPVTGRMKDWDREQDGSEVEDDVTAMDIDIDDDDSDE